MQEKEKVLELLQLLTEQLFLLAVGAFPVAQCYMHVTFDLKKFLFCKIVMVQQKVPAVEIGGSRLSGKPMRCLTILSPFRTKNINWAYFWRKIKQTVELCGFHGVCYFMSE